MEIQTFFKVVLQRYIRKVKLFTSHFNIYKEKEEYIAIHALEYIVI